MSVCESVRTTPTHTHTHHNTNLRIHDRYPSNKKLNFIFSLFALYMNTHRPGKKKMRIKNHQMTCFNAVHFFRSPFSNV